MNTVSLWMASVDATIASAEAVGWKPETLLMAVVSTVIFGAIGIVLSIVGFKIFDAVVPWNLEREICEKQNIAVAILCAAIILGICLILAAAVL